MSAINTAALANGTHHTEYYTVLSCCCRVLYQMLRIQVRTRSAKYLAQDHSQQDENPLLRSVWLGP